MKFLRDLKRRYQLRRLQFDHRRGQIASDQFRLDASSLLEELGDYRACIEHCETYLITASDDTVIGRLAFCYGELSQWEKAVDTYRTMQDIWRNPMDALGYALAELRCGNPDKTVEILDVVEPAYGHRIGPAEALIRQLRSELYWAENGAGS